jgi:hypothetical protein
MTARVKRGGFRVALGGRGFLTLGERDLIIVTLRVGLGCFNITLGRGFILTLTSRDDDEDEDEEELESFRLICNSKKTAFHYCSFKQCKKFYVRYEESLIY